MKRSKSEVPVSDQQIRELYNAEVKWLRECSTASTDYSEYCQHTSAQYHASVALGMRRSRRGGSRARSRARCEEIINARSAP